MDFLGTEGFWLAVAAFLGIIAQIQRNGVKTRQRVTEEIREVRRMILRHMEWHTEKERKDTERHRWPL